MSEVIEKKRNWREEWDKLLKRKIFGDILIAWAVEELMEELLLEVKRLEAESAQIDKLHKEIDRLRVQNEGLRISVRDMEKGLSDQKEAIIQRNEKIDEWIADRDNWVERYKRLQKDTAQEIGDLRAKLERASKKIEENDRCFAWLEQHHDIDFSEMDE